jgi:hypothetical protein
MFTQLNKNIPISEYIQKDKYIEYGGRIEYSVVDTPLNNTFLVIPERYRNHFNLFVMKISGFIPAHTDSEIASTINFYVKPDNCITNFYNINEATFNIKRTQQVENQTNGRIFMPNQLILSDSFVAKQDEVWLLDVTKPHSVSSLKEGIFPPIDRVAIVLQSQFPYEQVKEMLKETGYL